jgi:hypothetical protein
MLCLMFLLSATSIAAISADEVSNAAKFKVFLLHT